MLIDDLVTRGTKEPYRLFTSRAEYRLLLREDNADLRLRDLGRRIGLVDDATWERFTAKRREIEEGTAALAAITLRPDRETNQRLQDLGLVPLRQPATLADILRRPGVDLDTVERLAGRRFGATPEARREIEVQVKYQGYIARQEEQVARFRRMEDCRLPDDLDYTAMPGLSAEVVEKLSRVRPRSLGQAMRISGVTPAAIAVLQVHLKRQGLG